MDSSSPSPEPTTALSRRLAGLNRQVGSRLPDRAVLAGAILTAIATHVLFAIPTMIVFPEFRRELNSLLGFYFLDNPFPPIQFLGGVVGGYTAGYLTQERWYTAFVNGIQAVLLGVGVYYVSVVLRDLARFFVAGALTGSIAMVVVIQPLIFVVVPFGFLYFFQSLVSSLIGNLTGNFLVTRYSVEAFGDRAEEVSPFLLVLFRGFVATFVLVGMFLAVWLFVFFLQARY